MNETTAVTNRFHGLTVHSSRQPRAFATDGRITSRSRVGVALLLRTYAYVTYYFLQNTTRLILHSDSGEPN